MLVAADSQGRCGCPEPEARPLAKTLVVLCGPPAVGKMAVGRELSALTGMPLFHNHMSIEAVLPVFGFGTPPFNRLVTEFRERVLTEAAESDLPGLLFTYVWAFDRPGDLRLVESLKAIFERRGGRAVFAELWADLPTRLARNESPDRLEAKPSKRDVEGSRARLIEADERYQLTSNGAFPFENHLFIDNTELSPKDAAMRILERFRLPRRPN